MRRTSFYKFSLAIRTNIVLREFIVGHGEMMAAVRADILATELFFLLFPFLGDIC